MRNKLWVISELYYPEATSTGYILTQIAEGLATKGFGVNVLIVLIVFVVFLIF